MHRARNATGRWRALALWGCWTRTRPLPVAVTPLVGRTRELDDLLTLLVDPDVRLVTLLGPGGIGKTRLALDIAWRLAEPEAFGLGKSTWTDGVYFVPLQPLEGPESVLWMLVEAVGHTFQAGVRTPHQQLQDFFRDKRLLLVLDNFEHVADAAPLMSEILRAAPGVKAMVTSREKLNLLEEWAYDVGGLPVPVSTALEDVAASPAAQLFVQSGCRVRFDFALTLENSPAISHICRAVEGMPLGLELAAGWLRTLPCEAIAQAISGDPDVLASNLRSLPARHRSIRAVFDQTVSRLTEYERGLFTRLTIFRGGFGHEAARHAAEASPHVLAALVNKSLVRFHPPTGQIVCTSCSDSTLPSFSPRILAATQARAILSRHNSRSEINPFLGMINFTVGKSCKSKSGSQLNSSIRSVGLQA